MRRVLLVAALALAACGGSSSSRPTPVLEPPHEEALEPPHPKAAPLALAVDGAYVESTFRVDVIADGSLRPAGEAFEDPKLWWVEAKSAGRPLNKLLVSPAKVAREETDVPRAWNVRVAFSVYVEKPPAGEVVVVELRPPHATDVERFEVHPDPPPPVDPAAATPADVAATPGADKAGADAPAAEPEKKAAADKPKAKTKAKKKRKKK